MEKRIIFFSLIGCSYCEQLKPVFFKVANEMNLKYEIYELPNAPIDIKKMVYKYSIEIFPTILVIQDETVKKIEGAIPESKLREKLAG